MFSRSKNRPLELKLEDSNYAPAPSPQSIQSQPAVGQKPHAHTSSPNEPSNHNKSIKKLANAYNEVNRPVPKPGTNKKNSSAPTVINNYYYVQPPISPPVASAPVPIYNPQVASDSLAGSPRNSPSMMMSDYNRRVESQPHGHSRHAHRDFRESRDHRGRPESDHRMRQPSSSSSHSGKSPSKYPRLPTFSSSNEMGYYDQGNPRKLRNSSHNHEMSQNYGSGYENNFDQDYKRGYSNHSEGSHNSFSRSRSHTPNKIRSASYAEQKPTYDSFVKSSASSYHKKSPTRKETPKDIPYDIYSSKSIDSRSMFIRNGGAHSESIEKAKIPNIAVDPEFDIVDKLNDLDLFDGFNLLKLLTQIDDADINVHNDSFFQIFKRISNGSDLITIEQLGVVLFDPYKNRGRFSFRSLALIMGTFVPNSLNNGEMDFRCFVKMCRFIKGCFTSFNYHDKIENDHMLDFNEFNNALQSNNIKCPDELLAKIFATNESIDIEHYITAIIMIRKEEKRK